jgi:hypothetical protein
MNKEFKFNSEFTDKEWQEFRTWIISHLKMGPVTVTFTKKDGTERVMECTLQPDLLPQQEIKESSGKKENTDTVRVFDIEKQEWRSFTVKSVRQIKFSL